MTGLWKTDQIVTQGIFVPFIQLSSTYTYVLPMYSTVAMLIANWSALISRANLWLCEITAETVGYVGDTK